MNLFNPSHQHSGCSCCSMSRRCFLTASAMATAAVSSPIAFSAARHPKDTSGLGEYIELKDFRPKPRVTIVSVFARQAPPYWLGWPGTAYDVEGHRKAYEKAFADLAVKVGVTVQQEREPLESDESVTVFVERIKAEKPDAVLMTLQHFIAWGWADAIAKAGIPTIVFSPIGMGFTGHVLEISRRPGVHVVSSLELRGIEQALRAIRAKRQLEVSRLLVVAGDKRSESTMERLGMKVRYVPRPMLHELFERMPETDEVHEVAKHNRRHAKKIVEPNKQDALNAARSYITAKRLMKDEESNAITTDCLGMVSSRVVPTPPCMGASMFQDAGVTYGCEADVFAAVSLMAVSYLFDKPGFMQDPVPETVKNVFIAAHCSCGKNLNGFDEAPEDYILRSHSESDLGVAMQVLWREGQKVTLVRFQNPNEVILDTGTVVGNVQTPPAGGCRTSVEVLMDRVEDVRDVKGFHQVVFYGDHRADVEAFCQLYGIKVVHSPEHRPQQG